MEPMTFQELEARLAADQEYLAAERELRPELNLANDLVTLRVEQGWTQTDLARAVGTNQANVSRLEGALANPTFRFLKKVASALGAELDVRLRRPDDVPGTETMETVVRSLAPRVEATTATATVESRMTWTPVVPSAGQVVSSASSSSSC